MKNLHLLPTNKPTWLHKSILTGILRKSSSCIDDMKQAQGMNIYITSDEEIKVGDYFIESLGLPDSYLVHKLSKEWKDKESFYRRCTKVILTTDQELIADGVQDIYDEFLQWFIKNPNCDFVNIIKNPFYEHTIYRYKIIIPQEEPKEVTAESIIQKTANSLGKSIPETFEIMENFSKDLDKLKEKPKQDKWDKLNKELDDALEAEFGSEEPKQFEDEFEFQSRIINNVWDKEEPNQEFVFKEAKSTLRKHLFDNKAKAARDLEQMREWSNTNKQETLEEAAERLHPEEWDWREREIFKDGAKWQAERMYSEEEVLNILVTLFFEKEDAITYFEQFKKK